MGHGSGGQVWRAAAETLVPAADVRVTVQVHDPPRRHAPLQRLDEVWVCRIANRGWSRSHPVGLVACHLINYLPRVPPHRNSEQPITSTSTTCMGATMTATNAPALTDQPIEQVTANSIRTRCMDAVQAADSGHPDGSGCGDLRSVATVPAVRPGRT